MSLIRNIDGELGAVGTGVGRALELTAEAGNATGQIAARAAASGFTGIAQRVTRLREAIMQLHGQIGNVGHAVDEARTPVGQAPDQMSPQDTINVLGPAEEQIAAIQAAVGAATSEVGKVHTETAAALQGGQPGPMLRRLDAVKQALGTVAQRCGTARQHVETALAEARQVGAAGK